jgi:glycosyltransferase involved in cell wall biosynthesis
MACGSLVVTNKNEYTGWLLRDRENCLLTETTPASVADVLEEGLRDAALRARITANAQRLVTERYLDWDKQAEKVYQYVMGKV